eukprot:9197435-Ditylum_brightwellii.AAC.1
MQLTSMMETNLATVQDGIDAIQCRVPIVYNVVINLDPYGAQISWEPTLSSSADWCVWLLSSW